MGKRLHVAAVDDDPLWLSVLGRTLAREGMHADLIGDALQAPDRIAETKPDVVLVDYDMPRQTGADLARILRDRLGDDCPPIVLVTGDATDLKPGERLLFDAVFEKPVALPGLLRAIEHLAGANKRSGTRLRAQPEVRDEDDEKAGEG